MIAKAIKRVDEEGKVYDLTERFISEYEPFPFGLTDDLMDATAYLPSQKLVVVAIRFGERLYSSAW